MDYTKQLEFKLYEWNSDINQDVLDTLDFIKNENNFVSINKGLTRVMQEIGLIDENDSQSARRTFLKISSAENVADTSTINSWFRSNIAPDRNKAIQICFSLGLSVPHASEFLMKACRQDTFNFRSANEVIFLYSLKNSKTYSQALELIRQYDEMQSGDDNKIDVGTIFLKKTFSDFDENDSEFLALLQENKPYFTGLSNTAYNNYLLLKEELGKTIYSYFLNYCASTGFDIKEYTAHSEKYAQSGGTDMTNEDLLEFVFEGIPKIQYSRKGKEGEEILITNPSLSKDSQLSTDFKKNIPITRQQLGLMDKRKKPIERKIIVLFFFARYWYSGQQAETNDFIAKMNLLLLESGMNSLYAGNSFDWLILRSVNADDPFRYFNEIIELSFFI